MILTVTLNTALDITYRVRELRPYASHRVTSVTERPGGKGLNVARVLAALGHEVTVTGFAGGPAGRAVQDQLTATPGVLDALVPVAGSTRRTIAVVEETAANLTPEATQLNEPGPQVTPAEWSAFQDVYEGLLPSVSVVALCGSLPPGVPGARTPTSSAPHGQPAYPCCSTPAGSRSGAGSRPAPTWSSRTPPNSPNSPAPTSRHRPPGTSADAAHGRWWPHWARTACSR